jgi:hypothetical protein
MVKKTGIFFKQVLGSNENTGIEFDTTLTRI